MIASTRVENDSLTELSQRLIDSVEHNFYINGHSIDISASVGIAIRQADEELISVIHRADDAMYES